MSSFLFLKDGGFSGKILEKLIHSRAGDIFVKKLPLACFALGLLSACSSAVTGQTQPITILTPGAENAECSLYNEDMRYLVRAGETREINKSDHDLVVECNAPGNRQRIVVVESQLEPATLLNASNAIVPGVAYDHFSRGLYTYPEVVTVDFTGMQASLYPLPDYMSDDLRDADFGDPENMGASTPSLPSDEYDIKPMIRKKDIGASSITGSPFGDQVPAATPPAKK